MTGGPMVKTLEYKSTIEKNNGKAETPVRRLLVATPTLGNVRMEWVLARYGQIIPTNWGMVNLNQFIHAHAPLGYTVPDAQNMICRAVMSGEIKYEWLMLIEDDTMPPNDMFVRMNEYMRKGDVPIVSGLYFTKSNPTEPIVYRGRGNSFYSDWKLGDKVWADGVPTGCLLINVKIIKALWDESPEYMCGPDRTRRVFEAPAQAWRDPEKGFLIAETGTSDLEFCARVMRDDIFTKAGFPKYAKKKYPFLIDTNIFCKHIDQNGKVYP